MLICDSDVLIDYLRGSGPSVELFSKLLETGECATTVISQFELLSGARSKKQEQAVSRLLGLMDIFVLDGNAASIAAVYQRNLRKKGVTVGMADTLIASICVTAQLPLMTRNIKHFETFEGLELWATP